MTRQKGDKKGQPELRDLKELKLTGCLRLLRLPLQVDVSASKFRKPSKELRLWDCINLATCQTLSFAGLSSGR